MSRRDGNMRRSLRLCVAAKIGGTEAYALGEDFLTEGVGLTKVHLFSKEMLACL